MFPASFKMPNCVFYLCFTSCHVNQHVILLSFLTGTELNNWCGVPSICNPLHIELHLICRVVCALAMPCLIKPDMHHTWLCIMPWLCDGCLLCCLLLSGLLLSLASVSVRSCEDTFDYVRLSSSWTHSSSLRDLRQDDHTLEITSIFAC